MSNFKMGGFPQHKGVSPLKQTTKFDETYVSEADEQGAVGENKKVTTRTKGKMKDKEGGGWKQTTYEVTEKEGYGDTAMQTSKTKSKHGDYGPGKRSKKKSKQVTYTRDDSGVITKEVKKHKTKKSGEHTSTTKTKKPGKIGQFFYNLAMKKQEKKAEKHTDALSKAEKKVIK